MAEIKVVAVGHRANQRGDASTDVLILLVILAFVGFMIWVVMSSNKDFSEKCEKAGGTPVVGRSNNICYEPGTVKFVQ